MDKKKQAKRIAELMKKFGSQKDIASAMRVSEATVNYWKNSGITRIRTAIDLARLFEVSLEYILCQSDDGRKVKWEPEYKPVITPTSERTNESIPKWDKKSHSGILKTQDWSRELNITEVKTLPVLSAIPCGSPADVSPQEILRMEFVPEPQWKADRYFLLASGHSMEPTIPDGATVLMDPFPAPLILPARGDDDVRRRPADFRRLAALGPGIFAVFRNGGDATLKRLRIIPDPQGWSLYLEPDNKSVAPIKVKASDEIKVVAKAISVSMTI